MSTALVLGNQKLLININHKLQISDLYFPHVGQENHLSTVINDFFFRINGDFVDVNENEWNINIQYEKNSLVGESEITHKLTGLNIQISDFIYPEKRIYIRNFKLTNKGSNFIEVYMYFQNNFTLYENDIGDTVLWHSNSMTLVHYKKDRYIGVGSANKIHQFTCAARTDNNGKGSYPNIQTGELLFNPISNGSVNSCVSYKYTLDPGQNSTGNYFLVCGSDYTEIENLSNFIRSRPIDSLKEETIKYWSNVTKEAPIISDLSKDPKLNIEIKNLYLRSLMIIISQIDSEGAIIAANDGKYLKEGGKDTYSYLWPRDAAYVGMALIESGFKDVVKKYLLLAKKLLTSEGYFYHKYYPHIEESNSALASSWHPWINRCGSTQLPIQEDETALTLVLIWKYFRKFNDFEFIRDNWDTFIFPMANFLGNYRYTLDYDFETIKDFVTGFPCDSNDEFSKRFIHSKLPRPSYDIWEELKGISTHTCSSVYSGLVCGSNIAKELGKLTFATAFEKYADEVKNAVLEHLYDNNLQRFIARIKQNDLSGIPENDTSVDSSICEIWRSKLLNPKDGRVKFSMNAIKDRLLLKTNIGGCARKENDRYHRIDDNITGNPWFISTLWYAQYLALTDEVEEALNIIQWVIKHTDQTGLMAEQANPHSGIGESVKPLTWSHAEFVRTINLISEIMR